MTPTMVSSDSAEYVEFLNWVLIVHPEDEAAIEGVPVSVLAQLYPDVYTLGPAAKEISELLRVFSGLYRDVGGTILIRTLFNLVEPLTYLEKGLLVNFVHRVISDRLYRGHYRSIKMFIGQFKVGYSNDTILTSLGTLMAAHTIAKLAEHNHEAVNGSIASHAKAVIDSWNDIYADYEKGKNDFPEKRNH